MKLTQNLKEKIVGDTRDQRRALRDAGFTDEASASAWAMTLDSGAAATSSEPQLIRTIRRARPDLTLATARYIARQTITRQA